MSVILVFGRQGQAARELADGLAPEGSQVVCLGRTELDLNEADGIARAIEQSGATGVINAAAYTAVDRAESEPDAAFRLNRDAPAAMARACAAVGVPFVHISTDYVFDGEKSGAYVEGDPKNPLGVYGRSKSDGEDAVAAAGGASAIIRTAWVFSRFGANFVKTMIRLAQTREELGVVDDQRGCPCWARDLGRATLDALAQMQRQGTGLGVVHAAGGQAMTWADFAEMIFAEQAARGLPAPRVRRITTAQYPTPARRPRNSVLDIGRAETLLGWRPTLLPQALSSVMDQLEPIA
jgi:dTDP-4-dehydrorhamnose reductase